MSKDKPYVLIVEDDKAYGQVFKRKLAQEGFEVEWAPDGQAGFEKIKEKTPDLIILDLMMPKLNGYQVLEKLEEEGLGDKMKIIIATNLSQDVDIEKAQKLGANDYFVKSNLSIREMVQKVRENLEK